MPSLDLGHLDAFAAVARHRSFRRAAAARGVSASTLSQTVKTLEARLGVRLLNRTTRSVAPTAAGARLLERLTPSLADIAAAVDEIREEPGAPAGTVRINAPTPAIELVLAPIVAAFLKAYPNVRLEIVAEARLVDIVGEGYDAGVRWGEHLAQDMIAVPLGPPQRFVVTAAPELLAAYGVPATPQDLMRYPCIRQRFLSGVTPAWEFERGDEVVRLDPPARLVSTNIALQRRAVIAGVGLWATFEDYVADDLAAGRLRALLDEWCPSFPGPFLYHPSRRQVPAALRAFIDFAREWAR